MWTRRSDRLRTLVVAAAVGLPALAAAGPLSPLAGQADGAGGCVLGAGGGVRLAAEGPVLDGFPPDGLGEVGPGGMIRADLACPAWGGSVHVGPLVEFERFVDTLGLFRLLGVARLDLSSIVEPSDPWELGAHVAGGWTWSTQVDPVQLLVAPREGKGIRPSSTGPTVGLDLSLARRLSDRLSFDVRAGWRGALINEREFSVSRGIFGRESTTMVNTFPITVGIGLAL